MVHLQFVALSMSLTLIGCKRSRHFTLHRLADLFISMTMQSPCKKINRQKFHYCLIYMPDHLNICLFKEHVKISSCNLEERNYQFNLLSLDSKCMHLILDVPGGMWSLVHKYMSISGIWKWVMTWCNRFTTLRCSLENLSDTRSYTTEGWSCADNRWQSSLSLTCSSLC